MNKREVTTPTKKRQKKPPKPNPKFLGRACEICAAKYEPNPNTGKYPRFITHHLHTKDPEITAVVCLSCHNWMSGNGHVYNHKLKPRHMTDDERTIAPFYFASAVVELYDRKLIMPAVQQALEEQRAAIINTAASTPYKKETSH